MAGHSKSTIEEELDMIPAFLLALREGLEAALIVGILLGALRKIDREALKPVVWAGVGAAVAVSLLVAVILQVVGAAFEGRAEQIFEGVAMLLAAGLLTWMIFWMRTQAREISLALESDVKHAALQAGGWTLFLVAFLAVVREGIELALFLTATAITAGGQATLIGAVLGLAIVGVLAWALFRSLIKLNVGQFFNVTSVLLILFAAGLVAHGVHEFNEAGIIPPIVEHVWDVNHILDEDSYLGLILKTLLGYNGNPSLTEVLAYIGYYVGLFVFFRRHEERVRLPQSSSASAS
jgi:high-affinity iron transporter